jgi:hypothetical protein
VPVAWDGTPTGLPDSIAGILENAVKPRASGHGATALVALAVITAGSEGQGYGSEMLRAMRSLTLEHGLDALVVPVRPTLKASYPLTPMERYVRWSRPDGAPLDPWVRLHWRLGAEIVGIAPRTLVIAGTVAQWEEWTGMAFPDSGSYVIPGALQPLTIDRERDEGRYEEPNVWMLHNVRS